MKTFLTLLLFFPACAFAWKIAPSDRFMLNYMQWGPQFEIGYENMRQVYFGTNADAVLINKVKTVTSYSVSKNGKKKFTSERTFDIHGKLVGSKSKNNAVTFTFTDTLLTEINRLTNKHAYRTQISYDNQSRIIHIVYSENGKVLRETNYVYFTGQKTSLVEKKMFGKKIKIYRLETDFDPLLKTASESRYSINGKLKKHWIYSCDEKGTVQQKKVEEVMQCHYYSSNSDGSYISYTRSMQDGKDVLNESRFSRDSMLLEYKSFLHDSILISHFRTIGNTSISEYFKKNGKRYSKSVREKDEHGNTLKNSYYGRKDKSPRVYSYIYSASNLIQEVTYSKRGKIQFEYTYL